MVLLKESNTILFFIALYTPTYIIAAAL